MSEESARRHMSTFALSGFFSCIVGEGVYGGWGMAGKEDPVELTFARFYFYILILFFFTIILQKKRMVEPYFL